MHIHGTRNILRIHMAGEVEHFIRILAYETEINSDKRILAYALHLIHAIPPLGTYTMEQQDESQALQVPTQ